MVSIPSLWLPILLSAVAVFIASSLIHMVLGYHAADYRKLPAEDDVMAALRKFDIPPGDYLVPCAGSPKAMKDPAFLEKFKAGPRVMMTVMAGGEMNMGPQFVQWFLYSILIGITAAYIAGRALPPGRTTARSSGSRARRRSSATASRSGRRRSGTRGPGGRRSGARSTA